MSKWSRDICKITNISDVEGITVCLPGSENAQVYCRELINEVKKQNCHVDVLKNPGIGDVNLTLPMILIGNLADSEIVKDLYFKFLSATDLWYPGIGGYEIRTLLDPYGKGKNIIHIGYSDETGLKKALDKIIPFIKGSISFISEIHPVRLHISPSEEKQIRAIKPPPLAWMNVARDIYKKGYLGYLTDDKSIIGAYLDMWRAIVKYPITAGDQKIKDLHLKMSNLIQSFRLLETAGMIDDEELRDKIACYILNWPDSDQGLVRIDLDDYMHPNFPRQNHGMIPALGLAFLINYSKTYNYKIKDIPKWEKLVEKAYHPYMSGSWKPVCDGTCHGWWLSQPALLEYGLIEPEHRYFENGGAKKAAEAAIDLVNNNGIMPGSGDFNLLRAFPGISLRHAGAYYKDGRYKFVHDLAPLHQSSRYHVYMPRMFACGLEAQLPEDKIGISITPMDPLIYNSWEKAPELVDEMLNTGPDVAIEKTFDKLAMRTGWEKKDQYLLVDGLGNNSNHTHSYPNALGIVDYYHFGESWIVEESGSKFPEPENLSMLTISRLGDEFVIPSFGELLEVASDEKKSYSAMRLNNYSKTDWIREITMVHDKGIVIKDTVEVKEDGEFYIISHLRTPGKAVLDGNKLTSLRNEFEFTIEAFCSIDFESAIVENNMELSYRNHKGEPQPIVAEADMEKAWTDRYHTKERVVSSLDSKVSGIFKKGEKIIFIHIAYVNKRKEEQILFPYDKFVNPNIFRGRFHKREDENERIKAPLLLEFENRLREEVHSIDTLYEGDEKRYYVGHGNRSLTCFDAGFKEIWNKKIERDPAYCYWWELDYPSCIEIKAFKYGSREYIIAGCGDLFVRCFDSTGDEKWRFQYINGVPGRINIFDSNGDGIPEILVGGEIISNRSQCRVLGIDGKLIYELDAEFWTSRMTAFAHMETDNEKYVALGANRGRNLHLYRTCNKGNAVPQKLLEKRLAGTITEIKLDASAKTITAKSSYGYSVTFDIGESMGGEL